MALGSTLAGGGSILVGLLIAATTFFKWPSWMNYVWAALVLLWGVLALI